MKSCLKYCLPLVSLVLLTGCGSSGGSSSGSSLKQGTFVDATVEGLQYKTETQSGVTDENGTFYYKEGENVEFFIGDIEFGKVEAKELVTPLDMGHDPDLEHLSQKTVMIARLLQSLDELPDNDEKIKLSDKIHDLETEQLNFTLQSQDETVFENVLDEAKKVTGKSKDYINVDDTNATCHMVRHLVKKGFKNPNKEECKKKLLLKVQNYAKDNKNPAPEVIDYPIIDVTGVDKNNLNAVNKEVDKDDGSEAFTTEKVQGFANKGIASAKSALEKIQAYANISTNPEPKVEDYTLAGVKGVTIDTLNLANSTIDKSDKKGTNTLAKIQRLITIAITQSDNTEKLTAEQKALAKIQAYAKSDINPEPKSNDYKTAGVTGVNNDNLTAVNKAIEASNKEEVDTLIKIQDLVSIVINTQNKKALALAKIQEYAINNTNPTPELIDYLNAGVNWLTTDDLDTANGAIDASDKKGTNTLAKIQALITNAINKAKALSKIQEYAKDNSNNDDAPTPEDYKTAGVTGVTLNNLSTVNSAIAASDETGTSNLTKIQNLVNIALGKTDTKLTLNQALPYVENREVLGLVKFPLIRITYAGQDNSNTTLVSKKDLEAMYNSTNTNKDLTIGKETFTGSFNDYYTYHSNKKAGVEAVVVDVSLPKTRESYFDVYPAGSNNEARMFLVINDIIKQINQDQGTNKENFWKQFSRTEYTQKSVEAVRDNNVAAMVFIERKMKNGTDLETIFPGEASAMNDSRVKVATDANGKNIYANDFTVGGIGLAVVLHEWNHYMLNCWDYYGNMAAANGIENGLGQWGIMTANDKAYRPRPLIAPLVYNVGWANITEITADGQKHSISLKGDSGIVGTDNKNYIKINHPDPKRKEFILIENRNNVRWNISSPGFGLLLWHVDQTPSDVNPSGIRGNFMTPGPLAQGGMQKYPNNYEVRLIQGDGRDDLGEVFRDYAGHPGEGDNTDPFGAGKAGGSDRWDSNNAYKNFGTWWDGKPMNILIENISVPGDTMTFDITVNPQP